MTLRARSSYHVDRWVAVITAALWGAAIASALDDEDAIAERRPGEGADEVWLLQVRAPMALQHQRSSASRDHWGYYNPPRWSTSSSTTRTSTSAGFAVTMTAWFGEACNDGKTACCPGLQCTVPETLGATGPPGTCQPTSYGPGAQCRPDGEPLCGAGFVCNVPPSPAGPADAEQAATGVCVREEDYHFSRERVYEVTALDQGDEEKVQVEVTTNLNVNLNVNLKGQGNVQSHSSVGSFAAQFYPPYWWR